MSPKKIVAAKALELGATFEKVTTKTVSFEDLARASAKFIVFKGLAWTDNGRPPSERYDELRATAKANGFILHR